MQDKRTFGAAGADGRGQAQVKQMATGSGRLKTVFVVVEKSGKGIRLVSAFRHRHSAGYTAWTMAGERMHAVRSGKRLMEALEGKGTKNKDLWPVSAFQRKRSRGFSVWSTVRNGKRLREFYEGEGTKDHPFVGVRYEVYAKKGEKQPTWGYYVEEIGFDPSVPDALIRKVRLQRGERHGQ